MEAGGVDIRRCPVGCGAGADRGTVVGAYGCCYRHGRQAITLLQSGKLVINDLISHRMPLSRLAEALELVANRQCMKIHLYPEN